MHAFKIIGIFIGSLWLYLYLGAWATEALIEERRGLRKRNSLDREACAAVLLWPVIRILNVVFGD